jgi:hypothetical protein
MPNSGNDTRARTPITRGLAFERSWPYLLSTSSVLLFRLFAWNVPAPNGFSAVLSATEDLAGTMGAFMGAAAGILVAVSGSQFTKQLKQAGTYGVIVQYMLTSTGWLVTSAVVSTASLGPSWPSPQWWQPYAIALWLFVGTTALATLVRVLLLFSKIMKCISDDY